MARWHTHPASQQLLMLLVRLLRDVLVLRQHTEQAVLEALLQRVGVLRIQLKRAQLGEPVWQASGKECQCDQGNGTPPPSAHAPLHAEVTVVLIGFEGHQVARLEEAIGKRAERCLTHQ